MEPPQSPICDEWASPQYQSTYNLVKIEEKTPFTIKKEDDDDNNQNT